MLVPLTADQSSQDVLGGGPKRSIDDSQASVHDDGGSCDEHIFTGGAFDSPGDRGVNGYPELKDGAMDGGETPIVDDAEAAGADGGATPVADHGACGPAIKEESQPSQTLKDVRKKFRVLDPKSFKAMEDSVN